MTELYLPVRVSVNDTLEYPVFHITRDMVPEEPGHQGVASYIRENGDELEPFDDGRLLLAPEESGLRGMREWLQITWLDSEGRKSLNIRAMGLSLCMVLPEFDEFDSVWITLQECNFSITSGKAEDVGRFSSHISAYEDGNSLTKINDLELHLSRCTLEGTIIPYESDLTVDLNVHRTLLNKFVLRNARVRGAISYTLARRTVFFDCDMSGVAMKNVNFTSASLRGSVLPEDMSDVGIGDTDLSGTTKAMKSSEFMDKHFYTVEKGYIVYKSFGMYFDAPDYWDIEPGSYLEETVNQNPYVSCGSGVNVATEKWVYQNLVSSRERSAVWKCLIEWRDLLDVIIPVASTGKIRAGRVKLLEPGVVVREARDTFSWKPQTFVTQIPRD